MTGSDPEETTPFTHRPYGAPEEPPQEPFASPSAPAGDQGTPSWETYQQPAQQPPPSYPQASYDQFPPGQFPYGQSGYGQSYGQSPYGMATMPHPQANTAMILGIVALAGTFVCGIPCVVGPFAWSMGAKVRREIDAEPQRWSGRSEATAGYIMGIVTTILMILAVVALIFVFVVIVAAAPS